MLNSKKNFSFITIFPFYLPLAFIALIWIAAIWGSWVLFLIILTSWIIFSFFGTFLLLDLENANLEPEYNSLIWYQLLVLSWGPLIFTTLFGLIWYCQHSNLSGLEKFGLFFSVGTITGTINIYYARELMRQSEYKKQALADILLSMFLYSHFRSEYLLINNKFIGTPHYAATARYNESFYRFLKRILKGRWLSGFQAEKAKLVKKKLPWYDRKNPYYLYGGHQIGMILLAALLGGWGGLGFFLWQAIFAITSLEIINYMRHYGLTRKYLGNCKYENVQPHHSWNSVHKRRKWLSNSIKHPLDYNHKPKRHFPLVKTIYQPVFQKIN